MLLSVAKKRAAFLLLASTLNIYADEQTNVTVKLPFGAAFISYVSYVSDQVPLSDYKTLAVGKSTTQTLDLGDLVLVDTMQTLDAHRCDYFKVIGSGDVSMSYYGGSWNPEYKIDVDDKLKLVYQSHTNLFHSCESPVLIRDTFLNND